KFCSPGLFSCHFSSILRIAQHKRPRWYQDTTLTINPVPNDVAAVYFNFQSQ
ncbi:hypothetical protein LINGRAHAP2_LOCUS20542, partial [Linum grandiflorum]